MINVLCLHNCLISLFQSSSTSHYLSIRKTENYDIVRPAVTSSSSYKLLRYILAIVITVAIVNTATTPPSSIHRCYISEDLLHLPTVCPQVLHGSATPSEDCGDSTLLAPTDCTLLLYFQPLHLQATNYKENIKGCNIIKSK